MANTPRDDALLFTYEDLLAYAERWRRGRLTDEDRELLAQGPPTAAYRQIIDGKEYLVPLPRNLRLMSASDRLERRLTKPE